jgi:hypothetical protein
MYSTKSPTCIDYLQHLDAMSHCALNTMPPNHSGWHNSIMKFHHNTQASPQDAFWHPGDFYQITDLHY